MARETIVKCDRCGKHKGPTNHWYAVVLSPLNAGCIEVYPNRADAPTSDAKHQSDFCGEECLIAFISSKLTEKKKESDGQNHAE